MTTLLSSTSNPFFPRFLKENFRSFASLSDAQKEAYKNGDYHQFYSETELVLAENKLVHVSNKDELKKRADHCNNETGIVAWELR